MSEERQSSGFKYVFFGILFLIFVAFAGQILWITVGDFRPIPHLLGMHPNGVWMTAPGSHGGLFFPLAIPTLALLVIWFGVVAPLVYRDAKKRGMDPYLWASVAVFVPFFVGIIIYLVVRSNGRTTCDQCGEAIRVEFKACPYCGHRRELLCPECSKPIAIGWKVCPNCEHRLVPAA